MERGTQWPLCLADFLLFPAGSVACPLWFRRTNNIPRLSSAVRSVLSVATCTGFPDSRLSHWFSSSAVVVTYRPCLRTGIPCAAHLCTTEVGSPRKVAICCHPLRSPGSRVPAFLLTCFAIRLSVFRIVRRHERGLLFLQLFAPRPGAGSSPSGRNAEFGQQPLRQDHVSNKKCNCPAPLMHVLVPPRLALPACGEMSS